MIGASQDGKPVEDFVFDGETACCVVASWGCWLCFEVVCLMQLNSLSLRLWCHRLGRLATSSEHLAMQGIPILDDLEVPTSRLPGKSWSAFIAAAAPDDRFKFRTLAGNGMHRAVLGTWAAYILSSLQPRIMFRQGQGGGRSHQSRASCPVLAVLAST